IGPVETKNNGLELRDREDFLLVIPPDFPFDIPWIKVLHKRFAGFPHVVWSHQLCIFQSAIEWNPADGLYGFFERLRIWLWRAAINDMDPVGGPLEPPHHITDYSQVPFVIRANAPVESGKPWFGLAELKKYPNRIELVGWNNLDGKWPEDYSPAFAVFLPEALPMEFPKKGADFFRELNNQGIDRSQILQNLALASLFADDKSPIHLVLGIPNMRRSPGGSPKFHIAVWTVPSDFIDFFRTIFPKGTDSEEVRLIKKEFADKIYSFFETTEIAWCRVLEDRDEIVIRRDFKTPIAWFTGKNVLILGCGALGSWAAEIIARAKPNLIHIVDHSIVKPGLLARQNYTLEDIGSNKATALAKRLQEIIPKESVEYFPCEAHYFITKNKEILNKYNIILDCTASHIFQMKLEKDWALFNNNAPAIISMVINGTAQHCLGVVLSPKSSSGIWDAYTQLKYKLCFDGSKQKIISAFYSEQATKDLFQPEPGCSDPTFSGSTADAAILTSTALGIAVDKLMVGTSQGFAFSAVGKDCSTGAYYTVEFSKIEEIKVDKYRIRISKNVYQEVRGWVKQNKRLRSSRHETGGLLWGLWDDAIGIIWVFDCSGPPPDSRHDPAFFICGAKGTIEEHKKRFKLSHGSCGFIGLWHTHPDMHSDQSGIDMASMADLVSIKKKKKKRVLMLIFGRTENQSTANFYIYESQSLDQSTDLISIGETQTVLESTII
ncbi:MAG: ThiF family adenylyltransferase, partial [Candidatus Omnitrophica bacterium]|nr:ThiF family adenylyltransferase [Candidatus Omnitrophota bacterium]